MATTSPRATIREVDIGPWWAPVRAADDGNASGGAMGSTGQVEDRSLESPSNPWGARAWTAVALIVPFFLLAMAAGYIAYDLMGYRPENDDAPTWVDLVCAIPSLLILWVPCAAAVIYGRRSSRVGDRRALIPASIGVLVGLGFTLLGLVTAVG